MAKEKIQTRRAKEFGIDALITTIEALATDGFKYCDDKKVASRILILRDKLQRELLSNKIMIREIKNIEDIDNYPVDSQLTIYQNPYYVQAIVKNLEPFPLDLQNSNCPKWIEKFDYYLALHMLHFKDTGTVLENAMEAQYSYREILDAIDIIYEFYDVESPKTCILDKNNYLYYYPKNGLVEMADSNVKDYEAGLVLKALAADSKADKIIEETGIPVDKIKAILHEVIEINHMDLKEKAIRIENELADSQNNESE